MSHNLGMDSPGKRMLLLGNEAIARGALEAGLNFAAAYPGTPSSEILESLARVARDFNLHTEWSTNEIVAFEAAAAASWSGLRAMTSMKQNGLNVVVDFLVTLAFSGSGSGGLVVVVADDPNAHSSTNEQDSRWIIRSAKLPILEPSTHQEAKDILPYSFELSERFRLPVVIREVTRLGHSRGVVTIGEIRKRKIQAVFDRKREFITGSGKVALQRHEELHNKIQKISGEFETCRWNTYHGSKHPELLVVASGMGWQYATDAVELLRLNGKVAILKMGTIYPPPKELIQESLKRSKKVLFVEEGDYLEESIRSIAIDMNQDEIPRFYGKRTGHFTEWGELEPDKVIQAVSKIIAVSYDPVSPEYKKASDEIGLDVPRRALTFCPGCPHRATYWSILQAIRRNGNKGFVTGDIGCYVLGRLYHGVMNTEHCMGASVGLASGFGQLKRFGLEEPVIAVMGDSTFYHACIPALINILYNGSDATICILDNNTTAMTGFQPHAGTGENAEGNKTAVIGIEHVLKGIGYEDVKIVDPSAIRESTDAVYRAITSPGRHVIIFRSKCALQVRRETEKTGNKIPRYKVNPGKCGGDKCRICTAQFNCPAIVWDSASNKSRIDQGLCNGCGVCVNICPYRAIQPTKLSEEDER